MYSPCKLSDGNGLKPWIHIQCNLYSICFQCEGPNALSRSRVACGVDSHHSTSGRGGRERRMSEPITARFSNYCSQSGLLAVASPKWIDDSIKHYQRKNSFLLHLQLIPFIVSLETAHLPPKLTTLPPIDWNKNTHACLVGYRNVIAAINMIRTVNT